MPTPAPARHTVCVYASDAGVRDHVRLAVGRRPSPDLGRVEFVEAGDRKRLLRLLDDGGVDCLVLDGEAWPTGGMGLARQVKYEHVDAPPCLVLTARKDDRWLAVWSLADAVLQHPADPVALRDVVARLLLSGASPTPSP